MSSAPDPVPVFGQREGPATLASKIGRLQTQLAALSSRQLRALERAMVDEIDGVITRAAPPETAYAANRTLFGERFKQIVAIPLVLLADQTRHFVKYEKPGLQWLAKNRSLLKRYAHTSESILYKNGFFVFDHRRNAVIAVTSKPQVAPANTKIFRGKSSSRYFKFTNGKGGEMANPLGAFVDSLGQSCNAVDLVPAGVTSSVADSFACDSGCAGNAPAPAKKGWGLTGYTPTAGTSPTLRAATTACGTTGSAAVGGSADSGEPARGSIGGLAGGSEKCALTSLIGPRLGDKINACVESTFPGMRGLKGLGDVPSGGSSCQPSLAGYMWGGVTHQREKVDVNSDGKPDYSSDHDDNGTPNDPDDDMYTYSPIDCTSNCQPLHFTQEEVDNGEAEEQAADALNPPPADAKEPKDDPPKDPPPAPAPTDPAPAPAPDTTQRATDEVWDEEWELMYQNPEEDGSGDSTQCTENPQCREPDDDSATASCAGDDPSCSSGCTGNQGKAEAFGECVQSAISGTTPPGPSEQDPYINPAPEATSGYLPSQVAALAACAGGGVPSRDQCRGEGLALCPEDNPNCMCGGQRVAEVSAALMGADCERMMCSGASSSERSMATNDAGPSSSGVGACGCSSMMGGN